MGEFAPALAQGAPVAAGTEFKDSSPHFEHVEALTALVGTIVAQLFQAGAPFTDTLGNFRPIVISSDGISVNTSGAFPTSLRFHNTGSGSTTDKVIYLSSSGAMLTFAPDSGGLGYLVGFVDRNTATANANGFDFFTGTTLGGPYIAMLSAGSEVPIFNGGAFVNKVKAGIPSDADFTVPTSGMCVLDTTNSRIYFRVGTTWKYAALT